LSGSEGYGPQATTLFNLEVAMPAWNDPVQPLQHRVSLDNVRTATGATFDSLLAEASGPVAVEFMSYGCVHCCALEPFLQEVAEDIATTERVFRVNIAIDEDLAERYDVQGTPTFVMFLNGREIGRSEGPRPTRSTVLEAITHPFARLGM
jgi:thioredoxin 1